LDAPWFYTLHSINATFAVNHVTKPLTKFYCAVSKLLSTLVNTIRPLCDNPDAVVDPYTELQAIMLLR
jgi:hypothetical protein